MTQAIETELLNTISAYVEEWGGDKVRICVPRSWEILRPRLGKDVEMVDFCTSNVIRIEVCFQGRLIYFKEFDSEAIVAEEMNKRRHEDALLTE